MSVHSDAQTVIRAALAACRPDAAVRRALEGREFPAGGVYLVAIGKAAWQMAACAAEVLGPKLRAGVVVNATATAWAPFPAAPSGRAAIRVPDVNSSGARRRPWIWCGTWDRRTRWCFLVSGAAPPCSRAPGAVEAELVEITRPFGADIREMNTVRKRLSTSAAAVAQPLRGEGVRRGTIGRLGSPWISSWSRSFWTGLPALRLLGGGGECLPLSSMRFGPGDAQIPSPMWKPPSPAASGSCAAAGKGLPGAGL